MRNTLTIRTGNPNTCDCIENLGDGSNSIYISVIVGNVTEPKLRVLNGGTLYSEISLSTDTTNMVLIPSELYVANSTIELQYADKSQEGEMFNITFPADLSGSLTVKGTGYNFVAEYHVSTGGVYSIPAATSQKLGGVIVGDGMSVEGNGHISVTVDNALSDTSTNPVQNKVVKASLEEVFQSVSNGKALIASAVTDKGVSTENDATFQQMANNIASIQTGSGNGIVTVLSVAGYKQIINTYSEVKKEA